MPAMMRVLSSMKASSASQAKLALVEPHLVFGRECHDLASPLIELHADSFGTGSKRAGFCLEQEVSEGQHLIGERSKPAHHYQQVAATQRMTIVIQHLDHD